MISIKINVTKIRKDLLFKGEKGTYMDLILHENKNGPDRFQNSGFVVQDLGKEARARGEKGEILGNWKIIGQKPAASAPRQHTSPPPSPNGPEYGQDDVPF
jgi:hypothetical protein